jgi:hypothetical protein
MTLILNDRFRLEYLYLFTVCTSAGLIASFYERAMFPEYCSDATMDDRTTYDTMVRVAGSSKSFALAFEAILHEYNWSRLALLSDFLYTSVTGAVCNYGSQAIINKFGSSVVIPVYMKSAALSSHDYSDYLDTVRKNARSKQFGYIATSAFLRLWTPIGPRKNFRSVVGGQSLPEN